MRPRALAAQPFGMVPGGDQQQRGGIRADAEQAEQARRAGGDQRADQLIQAADLGAGNWTRLPSSRSATRVA